MSDPAIVVVLGMHRSGTSALSGALHAAGIVMGTDRWFMPAADRENPRGFFEDWRLRRMNDRLLATASYEVKSWRTPVPQVDRAGMLRDRLIMAALLRWRDREAGGAAWGWKDPRQCLTHLAWVRALERAGLAHRLRVVVVTRAPGAVATSMMTRGNTADRVHALRVWAGYSRALLDAVQDAAGNLRHPTHALRYEDLLSSDDRARRQLESFLGLDAGVLERGGLEPGLSRSAATGAALPHEVQAVLDRVEALINR